MDIIYRFIKLFIIPVFLVACSMNSDESIEQAKKYIEQGDYRAATITLKSMLQDNPDNKEARILLANVYLPLGDGASAEKELKKAEQLGAMESQLIESLGRAFLLQGDAEKVLELTSADLNTQDNASAILVLRGDAYLMKGDMDQAQGAFDKSVELYGETLQALIGQVKVSLARNEIDAADAKIRRLVVSNQDSPEVWSLQGDIQTLKQQNDEAVKSYQKSIDLLDEKQMTREGMLTRNSLARSQIALGKMDEALVTVNKLLQASPNNMIGKYLRAVIAFEQQDYKLAHENLMQILSVAPNHIPSNMLMGATQYAMGNYEQAHEQLMRVISEVPNHLPARKLLAAVLVKLRNPEAAVDLLQPSIAENPDDSQLLAMLGRAAIFSGDLNKGILFYKKAVENEPPQSAIRDELVRLYLNQGEYDNAIAELTKIKGKGENHATKLIIYAYIKDQKYDKAMDTAVQLQNETPNDPAVPVIMGLIESSRGMGAKAKQYFLDAMAMDKNFIPALFNLARVALEDTDLAAAQSWYNEILLIDKSNLQAMIGMALISEKLGKPDKSIDWIKKAADANPKTLVPVIILTNYYIKTRNYKPAHEIIEKAKIHQSNNSDLIRLEARLLVAEGNSDQAIVELERLVDLQPKYMQNYIELARVYELNKDLVAARETLLKAEQQLKPSLYLNAALSQIEAKLGHFEAAQRYVDRLLKDEKTKGVAYGLSGDIYMMQKNYKDAEKVYQKGGAQMNEEYIFIAKQANAQIKDGMQAQAKTTIKTWLDDHGGSNINAKMTFAQLYMQMGDDKSATKLYEEILKSQPNNVVSLNNLAWLYHQAGDARAMQTAELAYNLAPNTAGVLDTYGWLLLTQGETDKAVSRLREAIELEPRNSEIKQHFIEALTKQGGNEAEISKLSN